MIRSSFLFTAQTKNKQDRVDLWNFKDPCENELRGKEGVCKAQASSEPSPTRWPQFQRMCPHHIDTRKAFPDENSDLPNFIEWESFPFFSNLNQWGKSVHMREESILFKYLMHIWYDCFDLDCLDWSNLPFSLIFMHRNIWNIHSLFPLIWL